MPKQTLGHNMAVLGGINTSLLPQRDLWLATIAEEGSQ